MGLVEDSITLYRREMLIFKANLKTNIVRSLIFPLVIIIFFGNIGNSIRNTPVAVVNYANNAQSLEFMNVLSTDQTISVVSETNQQSALNMLQLGDVQLVIIILPNFPSRDPSTPGIQVYYSNTQPTTISAVLPVIRNYAQHFEQSGISTSSALPSGAASPQSSGGVSSSSLFSTTSNYLDFLIGGLLAMVIIFSALFSGGMAYISDRQLGIIKAFLITPIDKNAIVLSRILSGATQGMLTVLLALGVGMLFGARIAMGLMGLVYILAVTLILGIAFSALSMAMASRIKRVDAYAMFAQAIGMPLWFISGGIVPTASLPSWLSVFSVVDPLTYATEINRAVIMQGFISTTQAVTDFSVLLVFAAALVVIGFSSFKSTIE